MKHVKLFFALFAMLALSVTNVWGETYQHVFNKKPSTGNSVELSSVCWKIEATTLNNYNSNNYAGVQIGSSKASGSITLTSTTDWDYKGNGKITEVRLWLNTGGQAVTPTVTIGGKEAQSDGTTVKKNNGAGSDWTKATKVTFTPVASGNTGVVVINVETAKAGYICAMEIDCEPASAGGDEGGTTETVELPVFSATEANFTEAFNLTITSAEGTTLKYTTDKTDPTTSETAVVVENNTATVAIPAKSTMVKAIAVKGELVSNVKSMTFCYINSAETAYTVTEALEVYNAGLGLDNSLYIQGTVKSITEMNTTQYYNANYTITDRENDLYIFRGKGIDGADFTSESQLLVGDDLVIYGKLSEYQGNPQVAQDSKIISRVSTTKAIIAENLTFDAIALGAEVEAQTLAVTGANLTAEITATLDNEKFTVTPATLPAAGGDLTIAPAADLAVGEHTATLTLTSGETVKEVALSILVKDVYSINWSVNGTIANETKVVAGDKLVLPVAPAAPDACSEKVFVGWATTSTVNADGSEIEYVTSATVPTESTTYYAVFATQESEGSQEEVTITPSAVTATEPYSYTLDKDGFTLTAVKNDGSTAPTYNANNEDVRVYAKGTLTLTATNAMSTIVFNLSEQGKKRLAPITASVGTITTQATNDATVTWTGNATEVTFTVGDKANYGSDGDGKAGQLCFTSITVTSGTAATYTNYSTTCDGTSTDIENIAVEGKAVKAIVNGQLIIIKNGVQYNAQGQVIK